MKRTFQLNHCRYWIVGFFIIFSYIIPNSMIVDRNISRNENNRTEFSINNFDNEEDNHFMNSSFENYFNVEESDWQQLPNSWDGYPHMNNMDIIIDGEDLGFGTGVFSSIHGSAALKIWGLYDGENTENNVFQSWHDSTLPPGTQFEISTHIMSPDGDFIGDGNNYAILFAKYFTSDWGLLGMETSEQFNNQYAIADEWYYLEAYCEVPDEAIPNQK